MKERRGAVGRASGIADQLSAAMRRRQQSRESRVLVYDADGQPRLCRPGSEGHEALLATSERMVALVLERGAASGRKATGGAATRGRRAGGGAAEA